MSDPTGNMDFVVAALYRRYRPESFSEMIGQSQVTDPLMTALRTGRVGHAYLFSGPRGCGKTTSARILARCLNCAEGPTDTPCGTCPSCVELGRAGGGSLDVVEIDAASHGGVDDARDLRERAVFAPARDRFKIFIIDEAHMVTAGGFNALLKIVEEPPPHVKFIFATTEPEKVIGTIRSRTHHYPFRLIPPAALIDYAQSLCDSENIVVEPGVLPLVVRSGGGSARDTLSILDQLIAGSEGNHVTAERAAGLLGYTHTELLDDVVAAIGAQDSAAAFAATDRVIQTGQDPRRFVEDLLERLRDLIIVNATSIDGAAAVLRGVPQDQLTRMFEQARAFGALELSRTADTVSEALDQMTGATPPRLHLELMIARALVGLSAASSAHVVPVAPASQQTAPAQRTVQQQPPQQSAPTATPIPSQPAQPVQPVSPPVAREPENVANAAQTAASIREFLRNDDAGAIAEKAASTPQMPHPNEGAAKFGKPISAVLSASQIESIGNEPVTPAPATPASATPAPEPTAPVQEEPASGTPETVAAAGTEATQGSPDDLPGFEDLRDMWSDLLDELLENDRDAWNAVKTIEPLALESEVLVVGVANRSELEAFKSTGAGPLRETILAATGMRVQYKPRQVAVSREPRGQSEPGTPVPEEPHQGSGQSLEDDPVARAAARLSSLGPALAAPAWADPIPSKEQQSDRGAVSPQPLSTSELNASSLTADVQQYPLSANDEMPSDDAYDDPYAGVDPQAQADTAADQAVRVDTTTATPVPTGAPAPAAVPESAAAPKPAADHTDAEAPANTAAPTATSTVAPAAAPVSGAKVAPTFTRYGESVVREVLGASFLEEHPIPEHRR
ncbi:MAG: DNA polymerase III subunit gamma and tau [Leucobacter sp.]